MKSSEYPEHVIWILTNISKSIRHNQHSKHQKGAQSAQGYNTTYQTL